MHEAALPSLAMHALGHKVNKNIPLSSIDVDRFPACVRVVSWRRSLRRRSRASRSIAVRAEARQRRRAPRRDRRSRRRAVPPDRQRAERHPRRSRRLALRLGADGSVEALDPRNGPARSNGRARRLAGQVWRRPGPPKTALSGTVRSVYTRPTSRRCSPTIQYQWSCRATGPGTSRSTSASLWGNSR
jgi:hypothetical protein